MCDTTVGMKRAVAENAPRVLDWFVHGGVGMDTYSRRAANGSRRSRRPYDLVSSPLPLFGLTPIHRQFVEPHVLLDSPRDPP